MPLPLHEEQAVACAVELMRACDAALFIAGPAFNAGRYGTACAVLSRRVKSDLRIPALTGLYRENPGVEMCRAVVPEAIGLAAAVWRSASMIRASLVWRRSPER